jgi:predicted SAM-dependent methyltransferase
MLRKEILFKEAKPGTFLNVGNLDKVGKIHKECIERFGEKNVYGVDLTTQEEAGTNFKNQFTGDIALITLDNFFDTIYMGQVLEHVWDPKELVDHCYRLLKPGGVFILDFPNVYALSRMVRYMVTGRDIILGNPEHKIFYSYAMIDHLLKESGFRVKLVTSENVFAMRGMLFTLPPVGPLKMMGEVLVAVGEKPM